MMVTPTLDDDDDDDFVTVKRIKTYSKRRKRVAPLDITDCVADGKELCQDEVSPPKRQCRMPSRSGSNVRGTKTVIDNDVTSLNNKRISGANSDNQNIFVNSDNNGSGVNSENDISGVKSDDHIPTNMMETANDLDLFLTNNGRNIGHVIDNFDTCGYEVETVPVEDNTYPGDTIQQNTKPNQVISSVKAAAQLLIKSQERKRMKQSSLFTSAEDKCKNVKSHKSVTKDKSNSNSKKVNTGPNKCVAKRFVKQAGTNQLDLGAMFGLKPKSTEPSKDIPVKDTKGNSMWSSTNRDGSKKKAPFYKWIKGTKYIVDGFNYGSVSDCEAYFLSHFHSDHYAGLNKTFQSVVYCSTVTGSYVVQNLKVPSQYVHCLDFDVPYTIGKTTVTLVEANHCPGSAMFVFESAEIGCILHTGDFRYNPDMLSHPAIKDKAFSVIYLDTTYFNPSYCFPPQRDVINFMKEQTMIYPPTTLFVCGSYTIGEILNTFLLNFSVFNERFQ